MDTCDALYREGAWVGAELLAGLAGDTDRTAGALDGQQAVDTACRHTTHTLQSNDPTDTLE